MRPTTPSEFISDNVGIVETARGIVKKHTVQGVIDAFNGKLLEQTVLNTIALAAIVGHVYITSMPVRVDEALLSHGACAEIPLHRTRWQKLLNSEHDTSHYCCGA